MQLKKQIAEKILTQFEKMGGDAIKVLEGQLSQTKKSPGIRPVVMSTLTLLHAIDVLRPVMKFEELEEITFNADPEKPTPPDPDTTLSNLLALLRTRKQLILMGPPGVGKTYYAMWSAYRFTRNNAEGNWLLIQFHQSYRYEDFMERVVFQSSEGGMVTTVKPMTFVKLCHIAEKNNNKKFVVILDEINRADIPSVFGELLYALEYRGKQVRLTYSGQPFTVPENIYIIATANSIDRGTFEIGVALRRRFKIYTMEPDADALKRLLEPAEAPAKEIAFEIFEQVNKLYERKVHQLGIGHLFFREIKTIEDIDSVWRYEIRPLLFSFFSALPETAQIIHGIDDRLTKELGKG